MPSPEFCANIVCKQREQCGIVRSLTRIRDAGQPVPRVEFGELAEGKRRERVVYNCPNPISNLLAEIRGIQ